MLTDEVLEARLRDHFRETTDDLLPQTDLVDVVQEVCRHRQRLRLGMSAAIAVLLAGGSAFAGARHAGNGNTSAPPQPSAAATAGTGTPAAGPVLSLDGHSFPLPAGYQLISDASPAPCQALAIQQVPGPIATTDQEVQVSEPTPFPSSQIASAVAAGGGCVTMVLSKPYAPTPAMPDRYRLDGSTATTVDGHPAWLAGADSGMEGSQAELGVQLPVGGQFEDLIVGSDHLSPAALVGIVSRGLSSP
ncbi:MAG: hypothetical protein ACRDJU_05085 [Actinomycetota bacterium]